MDMLFLPVYGKNKMPDRIGCFIVGVPFVVAGIISMIASPLVRFFEEKIKL